MTQPAVIYDENWYDRAPAMLRDFAGPDGEDCPTPMDRRWLWRLESFLAVCGTTNYHRQMGHDLRVYLHQSCQHQWRIDEPDSWWEGSPRMRQCLWCNHVDEIDIDGHVIPDQAPDQK